MKYSIKQLKHLRDIRSLLLDDSFLDDEHGTEKSFFEDETEFFFVWLEKMEKTKRVEHMLSTMISE
ncbi:hypothetical protein [uncultured Mediterranean phage uvMED]|nr:hypothetical protein [uncultured Mediterranean phage uvMED]